MESEKFCNVSESTRLITGGVEEQCQASLCDPKLTLSYAIGYLWEKKRPDNGGEHF